LTAIKATNDEKFYTRDKVAGELLRYKIKKKKNVQKGTIQM
jgi:hypothetical protein